MGKWSWGNGHRDYPSEYVFNLWIDGCKRQFQVKTIKRIIDHLEREERCEETDIKGRTVVFWGNTIQGFTKEPNPYVNTDHHSYRDGCNPPEISEEFTPADMGRILASMKRWLKTYEGAWTGAAAHE